VSLCLRRDERHLRSIQRQPSGRWRDADPSEARPHHQRVTGRGQSALRRRAALEHQRHRHRVLAPARRCAAGQQPPGNWNSRFVPPGYSDPITFFGSTNSGWRMVSFTTNFPSGAFFKVITSYETNLVGTNVVITTNSFIANRMFISLPEAPTNGFFDVYIDELSLVLGTNAAQGSNFIRNGDFEMPLVDDPPLPNSFIIATNYANSTVSTEAKHSGNSSLHLVGSHGGTAINRMIQQHIYPPVPTNSVCTWSYYYLVSTNASNLVIRFQSVGSIPSTPPTSRPSSPRRATRRRSSSHAQRIISRPAPPTRRSPPACPTSRRSG